MSPLAERDLRAVLDFVGDAHDAQDRDEFRAVVVTEIKRLVPTDYTSYNEVLADGGTLAALVDPELPASAYTTWARHAQSNPLLSWFMRHRDGRPYRISDVTSYADFRNSAIYRELYRPLGIDHQVAFLLPSTPEMTVGVALSRGKRDYSERDRQVLDLTRPHLIQAYRNAELRERLTGILDALRHGLDIEGLAVIVLDEDGSVAFASGAARSLIADFSGLPLTDGRPPPGALAVWVEQGAPTATIPAHRGGEALLARRLPAGRRHVILVERATRVLSIEALRGLGLTPREAAVLHCVARGLEPLAVAAELDISPRTVAKHMQSIHAKLGVRNRAQAVATAWAAAVGS